jgi:hypothetical protein
MNVSGKDSQQNIFHAKHASKEIFSTLNLGIQANGCTYRQQAIRSAIKFHLVPLGNFCIA